MKYGNENHLSLNVIINVQIPLLFKEFVLVKVLLHNLYVRIVELTHAVEQFA